MIIFYLLIGLISGILSGLGVGGGVVLIPALTTFFNMPQQEAQSINLIYFIPTATMATIMHRKNKNIEGRVLLKIIIFGAIGAVVGALLAVNMPADFLKRMFGFFLLIMGIIELLKKPNRTRNKED